MLLIGIPDVGIGQSPEILKVNNKSFGAINRYFVIPPGWSPQVIFLAGKNIKELRLTRFYRLEEPSQHGSTHIALGVYQTGVRENLGQKLKYPIIPGHTYEMKIWLAWSPVRTTVHQIYQQHDPATSLRPVKLQLYGFADKNDYNNSLLAESPLIDHTDWKEYTLTFESPGKYRYFYLVPVWEGEHYYNGNLLLDNLTDIQVKLKRRRK